MQESKYTKKLMVRAENGDTEAQLELALCYYLGEEVEQSYADAIIWLEKAAEKGCTDAKYFFGHCYHQGEGVERDYAKSIAIFMKLAYAGKAEAQYELGHCYFIGEGIEQSNDEAIRWFEKAAEQGYDEAESMLGVIYLEGEIVEKDEKKAVELIMRSAKQGHIEAQFDLACCYLNSIGVDQDYKKAAEWLKLAANQGNDNAQLYLSICYDQGDGVRKNRVQCLKWLRSSVEQGNLYAQHRLGMFYSEGKYVKKDINKAVEFYTKAAEQGLPEAQLDLSMCYFYGDGVEKDMTLVWKWLKKIVNNTLNKGTEPYDEAMRIITDTGALHDLLISQEKPKAVVITEGATDWRHMEAAMVALKKSGVHIELFEGLDFEFYMQDRSFNKSLSNQKTSMGDSNLLNWCKVYSEMMQLQKIIFVADNDKKSITKEMNSNNSKFKNWGNNVYSFTLPIPEHRVDTPEICIEHLYTDEEIKTEIEIEGIKRRLFMGGEFDNFGRGGSYFCSNRNACGEGKINIVDNNVYKKEKGSEENHALSKMNFAERVRGCEAPFDKFNFENFLPIFETIKDILEL